MKQVVDVLVIEDDSWYAELFMRTLTKAGFTARHAGDGLAAIRAVDEAVPDVVVLDVFLPGPNGFVLLHEMQSYTDLAAIPVVICTNSTGLLSTHVLEAYGVRTVLDKSEMQPHDLVASIKRVLP